MVSLLELYARIKEELRFSWEETSGLIVAVLVTGFIFSFRDWGGDQFNLIIGIKNLLSVVLLAAVAFFFHCSCQKIYGLSAGHKVEFKLWWTGIMIALVLAFLTMGRLPLILVGGVTVSFMVRHRLGEFRYGPSWRANGLIAVWGILGNLILAVFFALGLYLLPQSYFFEKGLFLNLVMAGCGLIPLPKLDGLMILFSSRIIYSLTFFTVLLAAVSLATGTKIGLIITIVVGGLAGAIALLVGSEK
ncbi:MAG TPA: hypothetical protein VJG49_01385 [Candidatus Nanoarchaeia archaeon]|nr:hypothetical protein [Candidatus Nanoarchaeia archaeon]